ncbi:(+)-abscisic acid 8'-hydroxylase [Ranunculus cassubicifolius]
MHPFTLFLAPLLLLCAIFFQNIYLKRKRLPPGSMGWPYIGETFKLFTENPNTFFTDRLQRYGEIFKTRILGCPCVMISNPQAARSVLVTQAHLFKPTYPSSKQKILGEEAIFFHRGDYHSRIRKLVQTAFLPSSMKDLVSDMEKIVIDFLPSWEDRTINTLNEMKKFSLEVAMLLAFGNGSDVDTQGIKQLYQCLDDGYNSMPINIPGMQYRKAMKARKLIDEKLRRSIHKRRVCMKPNRGLLGVLLSSNDILTDQQIVDNILGLIFAARDTTASVMTWIIKYLHDCTELLDAVAEEQESIHRGVLDENRKLNWEDTRRMLLTSRVIQETLRTASVLSFTYREAVEDVEFEGYLIPKGWKVLPLFRTIHHSPTFFPQPDQFDPSRFEVSYETQSSKPFPQPININRSHYVLQVSPNPNTYMPFGKGTHACPGSELAKLEMFILIHHLATRYRWEIVGEDREGIQYSPFPIPKQGLPIKLTKKL